MKVFFPIEVDLRQLLKAMVPKKAKATVKRWVKNGDDVLPDQLPPEVEASYNLHWFGRTEPADAWLIE